MNIHKIRSAQSSYVELISSIRFERQDLYDIRDEFRNYYTLERIKTMPIEDYSLGMEHPDEGFSFCHTLEYTLTGLGETKGAPASKFGVYYGKTKSDQVDRWRVTGRYGSDADVSAAYANVRQAIYELVVAGGIKDFRTIIKNTLPTIFKGKILSTFYPDDYLNVFSNAHLNYFLTQLGLDNEVMRGVDEVLKREELVRFKNGDQLMRDWSLDDYMVFLYKCYPGRPPKEDASTATNPLIGYRTPQFPEFPNPEWVNLEMIPPSSEQENENAIKHNGSKGSLSNPDYEKQAKDNKIFGNRGETIVLRMEKKRLQNAGRNDLAENIKKAEFDYEGFDIKSFETNGNPRHIEVKTTTRAVGQANFFLSINEYNMSADLENYYVYIVYDIMSISPKIWVVQNPFHPANQNVTRMPISFRVVINTSKYVHLPDGRVQ